jgi:preprotein translocase subunit SecD
MLDFAPWKRWAIWIVCALGILFSAPNFFPEDQVATWPAPFNRQLNLGLDLRGGSHILLEADIAELRGLRLETLEDQVRTELRTASGGPIQVTDLGVRDGALSFTVSNPADVDRALEAMRGLSQPLGGFIGQRDPEVALLDGDRIVLTPTQAGLEDAMNSAMTQTVEVVRRRIDELGTREPTIVRQGDERILVQVPGLQDPEALKALLGKTARLEFKLVDVDADPEMVAAGRAPPGSQIVPLAEGGQIAVRRRAIITGDQLVDSQPSFQDGQPVVSFRFDSQGGRRFGRVTQENVGRPFAIILDGTVISAPRINEPILGGSGIIQGSFTTETANELAILLRSGKLPVSLTVIEERTVGPDLGADSIRAGAIASIVSVVLVALFMIATYGRFGVYSVLALFLNGFLLLGIMTFIGATLTLPGIAGFVLTIGAAVDANVLINERIREELRKGKSVRQSIENGYTLAQGTIFDANVTNIIASAIMFYFGSGPIKGFAVVLTIGIITSVFTAVTVTRLMVSDWYQRRRPAAIAI